MRTKLGVFTAFSALAAVISLSMGVGASAEPDAPLPASESTVEAEPDVEAPTTTTTVPTTLDESVSAPAEVGGPVTRTGDPTLADGARTPRIDAPGDAATHAERTGDTAQLAEPPPTPTTTTLPPRNVLPANSGEGRRIVYSKTNMWVWLVEADGRIARDAAVSGNRQWNLPIPGTYSVSSKSMHTCSIENPSLCWRYMVRFARGPNATWRDNIGFHEIPINTNTGGPVQRDWQLGEPLSGGCVRMATADATFLWNWAPVGTRVVVLP